MVLLSDFILKGHLLAPTASAMNANIVPILPHPGKPHLLQQRKPFTECLDTRNTFFILPLADGG